MSPHASPPKGASSKLFTPLTIGNGTLKLSHRVVMAPLTRNRGIPVDSHSSPQSPSRVYIPDSMHILYYTQRTTPGGLLITEGLHPSIEGGATPGVPGLFCAEQAQAWRAVVDAVHQQGGFIYAQIWHTGRAAIPQITGMPTISASATPFEGEEKYKHIPPGASEQILLKDYPPVALDHDGIKRAIGDYVHTARLAVEECGFDGVEVHGGNGYLPEQFLSSNINTRTDEYGGTPEKRCRFVIELMEALRDAIGEGKLALRLSPFGLFNQTRGMQRVETWGYLCREIKSRMSLSYVHFIEPRYEQVHSYAEKDKFLESWGLTTVTLEMFREIFGDTPFFSAGGWNDTNCWGVLEDGMYDALVFGRYFLSTPDLPRRLREGLYLNPYDRSRFYGPFEDREVGFVDYPFWEESQKIRKGENCKS